jgi:cytochrome c-type protein NapC
MSLSDDKAPGPSSRIEAVRQRIRHIGRRLWNFTEGVRAKLFPYWEVLTTPSRTFSLGFLTLGGFLAGIVFWEVSIRRRGNKHRSFALVATGCTLRLPGRNRPFTARTALACAPPAPIVTCHTTGPTDGAQNAGKEVWGWLFGTISTREVPRNAPCACCARIRTIESQRFPECAIATVRSMDISSKVSAPPMPTRDFCSPGRRPALIATRVCHRLPKGAYDFGLAGDA